MTQELEALKHELAQTKALLSDANGRIKAVERNAYEVERAANQAIAQAEALQKETIASIEVAHQQLRTAHSVACGIFGLAELARAFLGRKISVARMVVREAKHLDLMENVVNAAASGDKEALSRFSQKAKQVISAVRSDGETCRTQSVELAMSMGFRDFEAAMSSLTRDSEVSRGK